MSILSKKKSSDNRQECTASHWISVSDLMSALMMVFLLLAVFYIMSYDDTNKAQALANDNLISKTVSLEAALAVAEKSLSENAERLAETTDNYEELLAETRNLEGKLSGADKLLWEKTRLLEESMANYRALVEKNNDTEKLLAESASRLKEAENEIIQKEEKSMQLFKNAVVYDDVIKELHQSLLNEFNSDFKKWNAELREDLTFRFKEPTVLFDVGDATIKPKFKSILDDFFPRYIKVITSEKFRNDIAEVRIEGHTSSFWSDLPPDSQEAYFNNMQLSQDRSRSTLYYVMRLPVEKAYTEWLKSRLIANGLSSSKPVDKNGYFLTDPRSDGKENTERSQRVEFRVRIDAESKITKVIEAGA